MPYGTKERGRIANSEQESRPWRIHEVVPDFELEDVWALPTPGGAGEFPRLLALLASLDPNQAESAATRALWRLRDQLGKWIGLGRVEDADGSGPAVGGQPIPGTLATATLADRLPRDLRDTAAAGDFGSLPFEPLYRTDLEAAAEFSNATAHGVAHLGWVETGAGRYRGQMAVYVKPRGLLGRGYMALIKPFRHLIVYPALMRELERGWSRDHPRTTSEGGEE